MDNFKKFSSSLTTYGFFWIFINSLLTLGAYLLFRSVFKLNDVISLVSTSVTALFLSLGVAKLIVMAVSEPFKAVWQALWQLTDSAGNVPTPQPDLLTHGRELATTMIRQMYELGSTAAAAAATSAQTTPTQIAAPQNIDLLEIMPLPVLALDTNDQVKTINKLAADYLGRPREELVGKSINDVLQLSFQTNDTLETWLATVKANSAIASSSWDRVRMQVGDAKELRQFDLVARYTKGNSMGYDTLLALFDHTERYTNEDGKTSYVALAVHELRTPLTVLRGYIEVFEDELDSQLTPELRDFMHKMSASAQSLTAFVSNILNVARVDENQMTLSLHEANWNELLLEFQKDLDLRAKVRGKTIELDVQPNLPTVAVDKVSIYEVVSNLIDNAIKYSGESAKIILHAQVGKDGNIETIVQDFGVGIPDNAIKYLFTKYYRSHRNKGSISGSGLGLYLVKAIVTAHGGNVWVNSREDAGSSFGFSVVPYANVSAELKDPANANIERQAHGWIKNHSMYRR
jgi:two-component system sensor histidine kinase VicK